ncbi:hypothetical protein D3867_32895 (plasmid) [Azospirillum argentinense]|uniref:Uncharacterized protein n=1 Tax=Azospirillum brasilense TaxID=192 RepID=A0A4D8Q809_AZOBR|nr:hypothetical protein D3867_32895 [Azospirillum argentinense]
MVRPADKGAGAGQKAEKGAGHPRRLGRRGGAAFANPQTDGGWVAIFVGEGWGAELAPTPALPRFRGRGCLTRGGVRPLPCEAGEGKEGGKDESGSSTRPAPPPPARTGRRRRRSAPARPPGPRA